MHPIVKYFVATERVARQVKASRCLESDRPQWAERMLYAGRPSDTSNRQLEVPRRVRLP